MTPPRPVWVLAALMVSARGGAVHAASAPAGPPPGWEALMPCAQKSDPVQGFHCYQAAMRAAGYSPDPGVVAADRRKSFGLALPSLARRGRAVAGATAADGAAAAPEPEDDRRISATLEQVALVPPLNRLLVVTTEGAVWLQTDNETVAPLPKAGQLMAVIRGGIDGYFCQFGSRTRIRCIRRH